MPSYFLMEEIWHLAQLMNVDDEIDCLSDPQKAKATAAERSSDASKNGSMENVSAEMAVDLELLRRVAKGDERAFHQLVDRHADGLYRMAISLVGNVADAEDVLQETMAGAFRGAGKFEGRSTVKSWLTRILVTQAAKFWRDRRGKRDLPLVTDCEPAGGPGGEGAVDAKLDLQVCLHKLSEDHRQVIVLREIDGLSYEEMAQVLGVPRGTIESRLSRARAELKKRLKDYLP